MIRLINNLGRYNTIERKLKSKKVVEFLIYWLRASALIQGTLPNIVVLVFAKFENEFLRICLKVFMAVFTFYADLHWIIRLSVSSIND